jgi:hypothetical protein
VIVAAVEKVSVSDPLHNIKVGQQSHRCPWLDASRHIEQFDYYHSSPDILVKPCCSLRPQDINDFQLSTGTAERNIQRMKNEFSQGHWPKECQVCWKEEQEGMISERLRAFETFNINDLPYRVQELHVKFSNFCNLACRVCNTTESTTYGKIISNEDPEVFIQKDISEHIHWPTLLSYLHLIIKNSNTIRLCLVGGETTLAPGFMKIGQWLIDQNLIGKVSFAVASNTLQMPDRLLDLFRQTAETVISASLDSTHDNFHYVRWPGSWKKVTETISKIYDYRALHDANIKLQVSPNFNINNIFYFDDFLDYWSDNIYDSMQVFNVYAPEVLRIDTVPVYMRPPLIDRLRACIDHRFFDGSRHSELVMSWLLTTIQRLEDFANADSRLWDRYLVINAEFDYLWTYNSRMANLMSFEDRTFYEQAHEKAKTERFTQTPYLLFATNHVKWQQIPIRPQSHSMEAHC